MISVAPMEATGDSGNLLVFAVSMNTHSVDLSMDLADLSTLAADTGQVLQAMSWTGGSGHHVQGQLAFPSYLDDGTPLLEGATEITLTLRGVDAEERTFVWRVSELP